MSEGPTGYTGDTGPTAMNMNLNLTPGITGPTSMTIVNTVEPSNPIMDMFPSAATGPVEAPHIATIEELMASYGAIVNKETADKKTVSALLNENRESMRVPLFQWAAAGFPGIWIVQSFTIDPPSICSDGVSRELSEYFDYCLGKPLADALVDIQSKLTGITLSISFQGNTLRLHVTKNL